MRHVRRWKQKRLFDLIPECTLPGEVRLVWNECSHEAQTNPESGAPRPPGAYRRFDRGKPDQYARLPAQEGRAPKKAGQETPPPARCDQQPNEDGHQENLGPRTGHRQAHQEIVAQVEQRRRRRSAARSGEPHTKHPETSSRARQHEDARDPCPDEIIDGEQPRDFDGPTGRHHRQRILWIEVRYVGSNAGGETLGDEKVVLVVPKQRQRRNSEAQSLPQGQEEHSRRER